MTSYRLLIIEPLQRGKSVWIPDGTSTEGTVKLMLWQVQDPIWVNTQEGGSLIRRNSKDLIPLPNQGMSEQPSP